MVTQTFQQALEQLYGQERRRDRLGLEGTRALLDALGNPERRFRAVHVAGTNGKGSVCARIERVLRECGLRTGLFTSPHLVDFRERFRVDGRWADEAWLFSALRRIDASPEGGGRTFFEVATALGFLDFAERGAEWAVVEVGLGGRLDTTNVLTPDLCVITPIGLDHTEILGDTIEKIAAEKGGIVKPGVPVVLGAGMDGRARDVLRAIAAERAAPVMDAGSVSADSLGVAFQRDNVATARAALAALAARGLEIPAAAVARGLAAARWPGRFEACSAEPRLWWDGAHNPQGMEALVAAWHEQAFAPPAAVVLALSRDKRIAEVLAALAPLLARARLIATRSRSERAQDPAAIVAAARTMGFAAEVVPAVAAACHAALALAPPADRVLLTGSLFAVGEAMEALGGAPGEQL
ncbi:MAG: Mur ligase family protein [Candidatus Eisenbacteria bacterium]